MNYLKLLLVAATALSASQALAQPRDEIECRDSKPVSAKDQRRLEGEFREVVARAAEWLWYKPRIDECRPFLRNPEALLGASQLLLDPLPGYEIEFVKQPLELCDRNRRNPRRVDGVNNFAASKVKIWKDGWDRATENQKKLIVTHELTGLAGHPNEPWTTSLCWVLNEGFPGERLIDLRPVSFSGPILMAGGGSSGGRGGGDLRTAEIKLNALIALLDTKYFDRLSGCGLDVETAFRSWIMVPIESVIDPKQSVRIIWHTRPPLAGAWPKILVSPPRSPNWRLSPAELLVLSLRLQFEWPTQTSIDCLKGLAR